MCAVCRQGVLGLAFVEDGYAELHMDAWDFLAGLLIFEEAGGVVSGPPCSRT
jgi:myo-inositol-1(or 4)-monophosphatase